MPQLQNIVLTDRQTTPVNHTFTPKDIVQGVGTVIESTGVPIGNSTLTVSTRKTASGRFRSIVHLKVPVVQDQTINGITKPIVVREAHANVEFTFDESSTEAERNNLVGMIASGLATGKVLISDAVVKLEGVY